MADVEVSVRDDGPLLVTGSMCIKDADGGEYDLGGKETVALCRCGASENKPFCDGKHKTANFESKERAT